MRMTEVEFAPKRAAAEPVGPDPERVKKSWRSPITNAPARGLAAARRRVALDDRARQIIVSDPAIAARSASRSSAALSTCGRGA